MYLDGLLWVHVLRPHEPPRRIRANRDQADVNRPKLLRISGRDGCELVLWGVWDPNPAETSGAVCACMGNPTAESRSCLVSQTGTSSSRASTHACTRTHTAAQHALRDTHARARTHARTPTHLADLLERRAVPCVSRKEARSLLALILLPLTLVRHHVPGPQARVLVKNTPPAPVLDGDRSHRHRLGQRRLCGWGGVGLGLGGRGEMRLLCG